MRTYRMFKSSHEMKVGNQQGFSLVELAIVMVIFGLISAPLLQRYKIFLADERFDNTTIALNNITSAVNNFYVENGRYPCPSDASIAFGDPGHGEEECTDVAALAAGTCTGTSGLCNAQGHAPTGTEPQGQVHSGGVPYVTLGIPYIQVFDGFKTPISYSVSSLMDDPAGANTAGRTGAIQYEAVTTNITTGLAQTQVDRNIYFLLTSHGADANGSFNIYGNRIACGAAAADTENCDNDFLYVQRDVNEGGAPADYFDDRVMAIALAPSSLWVRSELTPGAIYNTNPGAVGVGTNAPAATSTDIKLDVDGDIKTEQIRSTTYCDNTGSNCFITKAIAGTTATGGGIRCPAGQYLVGVANNQPVCEPMSITTNVQQVSCGAGQYVVEITPAGVPICGSI